MLHEYGTDQIGLVSSIYNTSRGMLTAPEQARQRKERLDLEAIAAHRRRLDSSDERSSHLVKRAEFRK